MHIPFFRHDLGDEELNSIKRVLSGPILTTGDVVSEFEEKFAEYLNIEHVITMSSCTAALHMSLASLDIGPGNEVITTPMTFVATATSIMQSGATPVFVDVEPETGNLNVDNVISALTEKTRAIMPVHLYGQMCDMESLRKICDSYQLHLIEDCAHCIEGSRDNIRPGQLSDTACFSFYATKNITCGEGGAVATNNHALADKLRLLRLHGMNKTANDRHHEGYKEWDVKELGWKYNMDNIHAAILLPQLDRIDSNLKKRKNKAELYTNLLKGTLGITIPSLHPNVIHAHHLFPVWVTKKIRNKVIRLLKKADIETVVNYKSINLLSIFKSDALEDNKFSISEKIGEKEISLPFYPNLTNEEINYVANQLKNIMAELA